MIAEMAYDLGCQDVYNKGNEKEHISETLSRYFLSKDSFTEGYLFKDVIQTILSRKHFIILLVLYFSSCKLIFIIKFI